MLLVLFDPQIGPYQVLPLRARVDLGATAMKGYSAFPKAPALLGPSPSDCLVSYPGHSLGGGLIPLQRSSRCILQPQPTGHPKQRNAFNNQEQSCYNIVVTSQLYDHDLSWWNHSQFFSVPQVSVLRSPQIPKCTIHRRQLLFDLSRE